MLNAKVHLSGKIFKDTIDQIPTRNGFGEGLVEAGEKNPQVVALCADLIESTRTIDFAKKFPERFIEVGVAEQALATIAAGMANYGKIPFIASYAAFSPGRNWEQIRTTIALNDVPVKIVGCHAGVSVGPDGATHQMLEDIAIMRAMPNMIVLVPCDSVEAKKATMAAAENGKPTYLRFAREKTQVFTTEKTPFKIGEAYVLWDTSHGTRDTTNQVAIIGCGPILYEVLLAAKELEKSEIGCIVLNSHTISPIDEQAIVSVARKCGAIVTVEEHQINGGLGSAVAEVVTRNWPVPIEYVGMPNCFGESGQLEELLEKYGMTAKHIVEAVKRVITRKNDRD
ncbi:MAG: transketolase C-terminal domain-containing protein [Patescibacteria group bacterium]